MRQALDDSLAIRRILTAALGVFGAIALTLALGGIYAVLSYRVGRRQREIGIRMALGAEARRVLAMVLRQAGWLVLLGLGLGLPAAAAAARLVGSQLAGVRSFDPGTYAAVTILLALAGGLAALLPARRAARVDPIQVLSDGST